MTTSEATTHALAGVLYRTFEPKTATTIDWSELVAMYGDEDPFVSRYLEAATELLGDQLFQVIAGAISFPKLLTLADESTGRKLDD